MSYKEYMALKAKEAQKKKGKKLPLPLVIFLLTPFLIIFCFGLIYLPFLIYQIITGKPSTEPQTTTSSSEKKSNQ